MSSQMLVTVSQAAIIITAVLMLVGGVIGFKKAGSKQSLIAGVTSSALLIVSFVLILLNAFVGLIAAHIVLVALEAMFFTRLKKTGKFIPSGMLLIISVVAQMLVLVTILKTIGLF